MTVRDRQVVQIIPPALLGVALLLLGLAPLAIGDSYDWITHTTSEAAAQQVSGAWVARTGFVLLAAGAGLVTATAQGWPAAARAAHAGFAIALVGTALFPTRPWYDAAYDPTLDLLHSIGATAVGFAFTIGVVVLVWHRRHEHPWVDVVTAATALAIPIAMTVAPTVDGLLQRAMFVIAAAWYAREACRPGADPSAA